MSFYGITADYNGPLKQVNAHTDDDRYDMVELGAAGEIRYSGAWSFRSVTDRTSQISYEVVESLSCMQPGLSLIHI